VENHLNLILTDLRKTHFGWRRQKRSGEEEKQQKLGGPHLVGFKKWREDSRAAPFIPSALSF